jgi:hypothetical protein
MDHALRVLCFSYQKPLQKTQLPLIDSESNSVWTVDTVHRFDWHKRVAVTAFRHGS